jgi:hypothetical protein
VFTAISRLWQRPSRKELRRCGALKWSSGGSENFPEYVQHMEQEKGYSYQVYQSQAAIPECTLEGSGAN